MRTTRSEVMVESRIDGFVNPKARRMIKKKLVSTCPKTSTNSTLAVKLSENEGSLAETTRAEKARRPRTMTEMRIFDMNKMLN